jgi:hypothetical protein
MRSLALAALALAAAAPAVAQARPDFSGTWVMVADRSDFGPMPAPTSRTDVIEHKEPALAIRRTQATPAGENTANLVFVVDGKPHLNAVGPSQLSSMLAWEGAELVITSVLSTAQGDVNIVDRMALSADGRTMIHSRKISIPGQELAQTVVLVRQ